MRTVLHRSDDGQYAIVTSADGELEFLEQFTDAVAEVLDEVPDASEEMRRWFGLAIETICKYRGYKSNVVERRTIISGLIDPDDEIAAAARTLVTSADAV